MLKKNIYNIVESEGFARAYGLTFDKAGAEKFAEILVGTELKEVPQTERSTYTGRVTQIAVQLADEKLKSEDNPEGRVPGTWQRFQLLQEYVPQNTGSTLNPGQN